MPCISSSARLIKCFAPYQDGFRTVCDIEVQQDEFFHVTGKLFVFHRINIRLVTAHLLADEIIEMYDKRQHENHKKESQAINIGTPHMCLAPEDTDEDAQDDACSPCSWPLLACTILGLWPLLACTIL